MTATGIVVLTGYVFLKFIYSQGSLELLDLAQMRETQSSQLA